MSVFVFYIFVSAIVLIQCQEFDHKETGPHDMTDVDDCHSPAVVADIRKNRNESMLKPRERHVTLIPEPGYEFIPSTVSVKRCNGYCNGRWSPMPTKTMDKQFIVHLHTKNSMPDKCVAVTVQEHLKCRCKCMNSPNDCKPSQKWVEHKCGCECNDRDAKAAECKSLKYGMKWFDQDCSCACTGNIMQCPSGMKWAKKVCRCIPQ